MIIANGIIIWTRYAVICRAMTIPYYYNNNDNITPPICYTIANKNCYILYCVHYI